MSRRQEKANRRRAAVFELDQRNAFTRDRWPELADTVSMCPCGRIAWVMPGADADEIDQFYEAEQDHDAFCSKFIDDFADDLYVTQSAE